ncbi:MAG: UvrD-helicase domain-containing protein, partial [Thermodesulfobacteriota bacterium]
MKHPDRFDILHSDLSSGLTTLVEASAGTGKTYAIVGLFLRLIAETEAGVENILVVTYTDAATQELKGKVRNALRRAVTAFRDRTPTGDGVIDGLVTGLEAIRDLAARRLLRALVSFDQAAIFTIHGFCHRMLAEFAFESGALFDAELVTSQEEIKQQVARDFWRRNFAGASSLFVDYAVEKKKLSPDRLAGLLDRWMVFPDLYVVPDTDETVDTAEAEKAFADSLARVASEWQAHKREVQAILQNSPGLHRNKYRFDSLPGWFEQMDAYTGTQESVPAMFEKFEKFTSSGIQRGKTKGGKVEHHPFFDTCQRHMEIESLLTVLFDRRLAVEKSRFLKYARKEMTARKEFLNIHYFDDLLLNLDRALTAETGPGLVSKARARYRAVLIDEFQDTDTLQYRIFSKLFQGASALFFIGDPKQAIYGFRGADVFAYLEAVPGAKTAYTLGENWRSDTGVISGVNTLFQSVEKPFVLDRIDFHPVMPAADSQVPRLTLRGTETSCLELRVFEGTAFPHVSTVDAWADLAARHTALQVARLVVMGRKGEALLGDRPLAEADMAVLVRKNAEALMVQRHLARLHVNSTILKTGDLFGSREAFEMQVVLSAVAQAHDAGLVRAACATSIMSRRQALTAEKGGMDDIGERFLAYRETWRRHGFMKMIQRFFSREKVPARLMAFDGGERRCTNLFHLAELLHRTELEQHYGPDRLVRWLMLQRTAPPDGNEEHQLRLESDDSAV